MFRNIRRLAEMGTPSGHEQRQAPWGSSVVSGPVCSFWIEPNMDCICNVHIIIWMITYAIIKYNLYYIIIACNWQGHTKYNRTKNYCLWRA